MTEECGGASGRRLVVIHELQVGGSIREGEHRVEEGGWWPTTKEGWGRGVLGGGDGGVSGCLLNAKQYGGRWLGIGDKGLQV